MCDKCRRDGRTGGFGGRFDHLFDDMETAFDGFCPSSHRRISYSIPSADGAARIDHTLSARRSETFLEAAEAVELDLQRLLALLPSIPFDEVARADNTRRAEVLLCKAAGIVHPKLQDVVVGAESGTWTWRLDNEFGYVPAEWNATSRIQEDGWFESRAMKAWTLIAPDGTVSAVVAPHQITIRAAERFVRNEPRAVEIVLAVAPRLESPEKACCPELGVFSGAKETCLGFAFSFDDVVYRFEGREVRCRPVRDQTRGCGPETPLLNADSSGAYLRLDRHCRPDMPFGEFIERLHAAGMKSPVLVSKSEAAKLPETIRTEAWPDGKTVCILPPAAS